MTDIDFNSLTMKYPDFLKSYHNVQNLINSGYFIKNTGIFINRTPGRLDLMGGNDDYTGGLVFEKTIQEATLVAIQPRQCATSVAE